MWEKLLVPLALIVVYFVLSGGFMLAVRGNTSRMKVIFQASTIFMAVLVYSMAWHEELGSFLRFSEAWIVTAVLGAAGAVVFAIRSFREAEKRAQSPQ